MFRVLFGGTGEGQRRRHFKRRRVKSATTTSRLPRVISSRRLLSGWVMRVRSYLHGVVLGHGRRHGSAHFGHRDLLRGHLRARLDLARLPVRRGRHRAELQTATDRRGSAGGREPHRRRHRGGPARAGRPDGRSRDRRHPGRRERRGEHLARLVRVRVSWRARVPQQPDYMWCLSREDDVSARCDWPARAHVWLLRGPREKIFR